LQAFDGSIWRKASLSYQSWLDILRCPACVSEQRADPGRLDLVADRWLVCQDCNRKYPIRDDIPVMLIVEGDKHRQTSLAALAELET
jgi:uncharacterized protein YbaR (Trm112 family)